MFPEEHDENVTFLQDLVAGSIGETVKMLSDLSLTGQTCQAVVVNPNGLRSIIACTVSSDGSYAYFTTTPTTFPYPGTYQVMLQIVTMVNDEPEYNNVAPFTLNVIAAI
jgi:hypothetical protein